MKFLIRKKPIDGLTFYEQILIYGRSMGLPFDSVHETANDYVKNGHNGRITDIWELRSTLKDVFQDYWDY